MNHGIKHKKFGRRKEHRNAMFVNLCKSLANHGIIKTTLAKAKSLRPVFEKVVTTAKKDDLSARRQVISFMKGNCPEVQKVFEIAKASASRPGGYTRIMKAGFRKGDNAPMAYIETVDRELPAAE